IAAPTDRPLRFMYVIGFSKTQLWPATTPLPTIPWNLLEPFSHSAFACSAIRSSIRNPALCRVVSYLGSGLPRPTSNFIGRLQGWSGSLDRRQIHVQRQAANRMDLQLGDLHAAGFAFED